MKNRRSWGERFQCTGTHPSGVTRTPPPRFSLYPVCSVGLFFSGKQSPTNSSRTYEAVCSNPQTRLAKRAPVRTRACRHVRPPACRRRCVEKTARTRAPTSGAGGGLFRFTPPTASDCPRRFSLHSVGQGLKQSFSRKGSSQQSSSRGCMLCCKDQRDGHKERPLAK